MNRERKIVVATVLGLLALGLTTGGIVKADFGFGKAQSLGIRYTPASTWGISVTADELELYFSENRPGGLGGLDIWVSTRRSVNDPWGPLVNLGAPANSQYDEAYPSVSADGLTLYFSDFVGSIPDHPGGLGGHDIWMVTRASRSAPWTAPVNVGAPVNTSANDTSPTISQDGLTLMLASKRDTSKGYYDLWMTTRPTAQDPWAAPVNLGAPVNTAAGEWNGHLSPDGRVLFFDTGPSGDMGWSVGMTTRKTLNDPWGPPVLLDSSFYNSGPVSTDGRRWYILKGGEVCCVPILPIVDYDGDGVVGLGDLVRFIESWGKDDPLADIGPYAWGDGKVDEKDLEVFMSYWGQEVCDPTLIAHWKLDEASGMIATDSVGTNKGTLIGLPTWQPTGGKIGGALKFDGGMRFIMTQFVYDPSNGPFSAFAWVKGGAPGQVVLSQGSGANWLMAGAGSGVLAGHALTSSAIITDGAWHRIGFVWNGSNRILYVDGVEVARDTMASLPGSTSGLYIGGAYNLAPGSFWSGLIDDVRIYNRAVKPTGK